MAIKINKVLSLKRKVKHFGKIGVLMGGPSSEREISLKSGKAIYDSLADAGLDAVAIDIITDSIKGNVELLRTHRIDCAFLALHGRFGEDGTIQGILDRLQIPYTHSGKTASRLAMDKIASRKILAKNGIAVPSYCAINKSSLDQKMKILKNIKFPVVVKPATHGSSIGLSIVETGSGLAKAVSLAFGFDDFIIIEEYIKGREMTVGVLDKRPLPVIEIVPKKQFFDFQAKYQPGMTEYIVPAQIEQKIARKIQVVALKVHNVLGCYGCSRIDIILKGSVPFVLEANTIPGFTQTSLLPKAAKVVGIDFGQLCFRLIELAYAKK